MTSQKRIVVHVGVHKTGTTSIQEFLHIHRETLRTLSVDFYLGAYIPSNHVELHVAAMRFGRSSPFKMSKDLTVDETFRDRIRKQVHESVTNSSYNCVVFSAEGLSYLRYEDEMQRLKDMFPESRIDIVMYVRDAAGFLASYVEEMKKHRLPQNIEKDSFAYTGQDSWLIDFESRLSGFRSVFGRQNVITIDYDHELRKAGSVIPSFLGVLGVSSYFRAQDWEGFFLNRTPTT